MKPADDNVSECYDDLMLNCERSIWNMVVKSGEQVNLNLERRESLSRAGEPLYIWGYGRPIPSVARSSAWNQTRLTSGLIATYCEIT